MGMPRSNVRLLASGLLVALLAACGGGSGGSGTGTTTTTTTTTTVGSPSADVVDKYAGTWTGCFPDSPGSMREVLTINKVSATTISFSFVGTHFPTTNCTGTSDGGDSGSGTGLFVGTKLIGTETVDKVNLTQGTTTTKQVVLIRADGKFYSGIEAADGGPVDADGYPTTIDTGGLTKS